MEQSTLGEIGRRRFLATGAGVALSVPLLAGLPRAALAARTGSDEGWPATPDEALLRLMDGNRRFVEGRTTAPNRNLARVKETAPKQAPFAAFLGCADSRVPIEIVFD